MSHNYDFDIAVIGAGPGGYVTAIKAAQLGKKTCIIEKEYLGGTCLNVGCIPTKTMIKSVNMLRGIREAAHYAIEGAGDKPTISMPRLQERKKKVVSQLVGGVGSLLRGNKVEFVPESASFIDAHTLQAGGRRISAEYIIVATGSKAIIPHFITMEGNNNILTSAEALALDHVPERTVIVGGGVIGIEFAYILSQLGSRVFVLELLDHILPMVDKEISSLAKTRMEKDGVVFKLGAKVLKIKDNTVFYEQSGAEQNIQAEAILMAVGRAPNTEGLNAQAVGLELERGAIKVDDNMKTNIDNIYAIGDVNGKVMLAHTASHEGLIALDTICGKAKAMNYERIPSCVYLDPEIACIGLTEEDARKRYDNIKVGKFPMIANGKSLVEGDTGGLFKVIVEGTHGEVIGAHLYGHHVTDMISQIALAMEGEICAEEIMHTVFPHPTVSEALPEAFMAATGRAIHT